MWKSAGVLHRGSCTDRKMPFDIIEIRRLIQEEGVARYNLCRGLARSNIVFFGESPREWTASFVSGLCLFRSRRYDTQMFTQGRVNALHMI